MYPGARQNRCFRLRLLALALLPRPGSATADLHAAEAAVAGEPAFRGSRLPSCAFRTRLVPPVCVGVCCSSCLALPPLLAPALEPLRPALVCGHPNCCRWRSTPTLHGRRVSFNHAMLLSPACDSDRLVLRIHHGARRRRSGTGRRSEHLTPDTPDRASRHRQMGQEKAC
jgi:hypothetical protein